MPNSTWNLGFHLHSPRAWMNDPNGCCQFRGVYHFFYQYDHAWPEVDQKGWGAFSSTDLIHWRFDGVPLEPSIPEDRHGTFTGTTYVEKGTASDGGDRMRVFYTGNVVDPGPDTKLASTRSSSDRANDIIAPAAREGAIMGMVIKKNTFHGLAPRSMAASSIDRSSSRRRDDTTTAT